LGIKEDMTREYKTLIGDGKAIVTVHYEINGDRNDFVIEVMSVYCEGVDVFDCLLIQQIVEVEMEISKHHNKLMSGMADI
jgi:hypothetical protein